MMPLLTDRVVLIDWDQNVLGGFD